MASMFSSRVPDSLAPNQISRLVGRLRTSGARIIDLTESNPTRVGFDYPPGLAQPRGAEAVSPYDPRPFGLPQARRAVAEDLARRGVQTTTDRVVLTASTSEAYSLVFKLLCDPGDVVMTPRPSYPLFEHLTRLDGVNSIPYALDHDGRWRVDVNGLRRDMPPRARAILLVNPNNPTGSFLTGEEIEALVHLARERSVALIGDEVFADYPLHPPARPASVLGQREALTFALGGLSKSVGLPQLKLAWIVLSGPDTLVAEAQDRLEYICDAYLSVASPVQRATARLLAAGVHVRRQIQTRIEANLEKLCAAAAGHPSCRVLPVEGGWSAVVQVPATTSEEALVLNLLALDGVLVHPGYFFDFPTEAYLVISLLPAPDDFSDAIERLFARISGDS